MTDSGTLSYRRIQVDSLVVGMVGLEELFDDLCRQNVAPDEAAVPELLRGARRHNYIPPAAEEGMGAALLREYRRFRARPASGEIKARRYGAWRRHPRETIPWYPTIHAELCGGCGACLRFCSFGVYAATEDGRVEVVEPFRCQVGCDACVDLCKPRAIVFPPAEMLKAYRV